MPLRYQRYKQIGKIFPRILPGTSIHKVSEKRYSAFSAIIVPNSDYTKSGSAWHLERDFCSQWYSTISQVSNETNLASVNDHVLTFIKSTLNELQGPNHCWLNKVDEGDGSYFKEDEVFLILSGKLVRNSQVVSMIEKIKSLQQRFPQLCIMGLHYGSSNGFSDDHADLVELIMKEFITFPILLSKKNFSQTENEAHCILFKDFSSPILYHEEDLDIELLNQVIQELQEQKPEIIDSGISSSDNLKRAWVKQIDVIKEPALPSFLQNLLFYFPGCVSEDESTNRLFLSDCNHHRIIIVDGSGKIIDSIGSSPGFEDGEFESAKLLRPAASFYDDAEDCLYIVDSENQAIRRADLERRVLETLYPTCSISKTDSSLWAWILNKMGFGRNTSMKSKDHDSQLLFFPWHILKPDDDSLMVINRSFGSMWVIDLASGEIKETVEGLPKILETCGQLIMDKVSLLKQVPDNWLRQQIDVNCSPEGLPFASLLSSVASLGNNIIMCDTAAQTVLKLDTESKVWSNFQFSNFGILGFPYWPSFPLERVYSDGVSPGGGWIDHFQRFNLLPGRIDIRLNLDIPVDIELVEPPQEGCIWRQARGAATEIFGREDAVGTSEKVGSAQQWYDDLDNLAFSTPEPEVIVEDSCTTSDVKSEYRRVHIDCAFNTSPGTCEVIIYVALYLKLKRDPELGEQSQAKYAARIAEIVNPAKRVEIGRDSCLQLLLKSKADLRNLIFIKPLHVRIKIDSLDHPKAENEKDIILTDDTIEVNVTF